MHPPENDLPFEPAPALGHRHVQTFWGRLTRPRLLVPLRREVLPTPDGDELVLDHLDGPAGAPRVVLLHGLEGSAHSCYVQGLLAQLGSRGLRAVALNFRSCARDLPDLGRNIPNRAPRLYHSGETADFDYLVKSLVAAEPGVAHAAIGVSLGGNVLLKWLGENPGQLHLAAAATISVPYDLEAGARKLEKGLGPVYTSTFLRGLRRKARQLLRRHPEASRRFDPERMRSARTFFEFDDAVTAPLHGFRDTDDYWTRASSKPGLRHIAVPTLLLNARNDPILPASALPAADEVAAQVMLEFPESGGHVGFVTGMFPGKLDWLPQRVLAFFDQC